MIARGSKAFSKMFSNIFTEKNLQKSGLRQFKPKLFRGQKISSPESSQACAALWRVGGLVNERSINRSAQLEAKSLQVDVNPLTNRVSTPRTRSKFVTSPVIGAFSRPAWVWSWRTVGGLPQNYSLRWFSAAMILPIGARVASSKEGKREGTVLEMSL